MNEAQMKDAIAFQKAISEEHARITTFIKSEEFKNVDGLNKDLLLTQINAMQSLLGILTIRVGINLSQMRQDQTKEDPKEAENEKTATQDNRPEQ